MFWRTILVTFFAFGALGYSDKKEIIMDRYQPMCEQTGNLDKLDDLVTTIDNSMKCFEDTIDMDTLPREIRNAIINGGLKELLKSQCAKSSQLKTCWHTLIDGISLCLNADMREFFAASNFTDEFIDFACYNDGERIIKFIFDDGPLCIQERLRGVDKCVEEIQQKFSRRTFSNVTSIEQCAAFNDFSSCLSKEFKTCSTSAAADLIETTVQIVRRSSPCK